MPVANGISPTPGISIGKGISPFTGISAGAGITGNNPSVTVPNALTTDDGSSNLTTDDGLTTLIPG